MTAAANPHTGLYSLIAAARSHGVDLSIDRLIHAYALEGRPMTVALLLTIARESGLRARQSRISWEQLCDLRGAYPALAQLDNGNWVLCLGVDRRSDGIAVRILDPLSERPEALSVSESSFRRRWPGDVLLLKRGHSLAEGDQPFRMRWFVPELARQRRLFLDVTVAAIVLNLLGLTTPLFFQMVIDKVLAHESYRTLYVLGAGVVIALLFDAVFGFLRRWLLLFATNRIDIRVATRTFGHLLSLPIAFFEQMPAGVLVRHMQQSARIREFLTGRLFLLLLDASFLLVFVPLLVLYSPRLTMIVLLFAGLIAVVIALLVGPFQRQLRALYEAEGQRQALLVESVHGMRTVKSLAMEPLQRRLWDVRSAAAIVTRFRVEKISTTAQAATGLLEKLMTVAIIGLGAKQVFDGSITVGALVAFNMLAGRVSGPLSQIVTMAHDYQDAALSVRMLGEVMNRRPEGHGPVRGLSPPLQGKVEFERVSFRYGADGPPTLDGVSFAISAGSIFGIVGRSGSGKTTVTRLIQGLYPVQQGLVRIDGLDIRELDLVHLRKSIGVVLQDSFLFRGTVRDNISAAKPDATFEEIVSAAQLAGAEEFIERLPRGFDTILEENAENLSGGQRQRLAIARALITRPRLLIMDEATSALDPDSELIIRRNMRRIAEGRTLIIVSHRLVTLADAHAILVLESGRITDLGSHAQLLARCGIYRNLWQQQASHAA
jgi:ATP-binding cassette subfamily B protein